MFTGIVRTKGPIREMSSSEEGVTFRFEPGELLSDLDVGHSISVEGVCLTVTRKEESWAEVDATPETLRRSNLGDKHVGDFLNLEPSLRITDFLGGHLVQGHVDAVGKIDSIRREGNSWIYSVTAPVEVLRYCVMKGSLTINGVSLTISAMEDERLEVTIIPHTYEVTNFSDLETGDQVNLEVDVISKYVENHVRHFMGGAGFTGSESAPPGGNS